MALITIPLKPETVRKLKRVGHKGETYNEVVNRLVDQRLFEVALPRCPPATRKEVERENAGEETVSLDELAEELGIVDILREEYGIEV